MTVTPLPVSASDPAGDSIQDILSALKSELTDTFDQIDLAEEEIRKAAARHSADADLLFHCFSLLRPTVERMTTPFVYCSHIREILARVRAGQDTRPGTAAEVCLALGQASRVAPLNTTAMGLYTRAWHLAGFPEATHFRMPDMEHYEALAGSQIDDMEAETRAAIGRRQSWRTLGEITCCGLHHATQVACRFAGTTASRQPDSLAS